MNYYTIYEKLLISLYFLCHLFFLQKISNISLFCKFLRDFFCDSFFLYKTGWREKERRRIERGVTVVTVVTVFSGGVYGFGLLSNCYYYI